MTKVLMLGWEFPPLLSGGLGIATYGIVKALSSTTRIRLIIPSAGNDLDLDNVNIIGLNKVTAAEVNLERLQFNLSFPNTEVSTIPLSVSPYHHINASLEEGYRKLESLRSTKKTIDHIHDIFSSNEVYGAHVMHKVYVFATLAEELAADGDFDVIHAHDWITYSAGINIKQRTGKPLVLHVHALETDRAGDTARNEIYWLEKNSMEYADRIIAVSQYTKDKIIEHYQIDAGKIHVVHNGIEPLLTIRKEHRIKDKLVAFLGRLTNQKGPQFLLETAEKVASVYPRVKFVVAGTGDQFIHLLETSAYKKIGSKFIFTGFLSKEKVNELLAMIDVYFMPSISEPFGLTALEAAQHNIPSVISIQSGAAEVMKSSLKADFWDTDKFANYIYALLKYNALAKVISENNQRELDTLTWNHAAAKIQTIYSAVIN